MLRTAVADLPGRDPAIRFFALDEEMGAPAWFSTVLLLLVAQGLWLLADRDAGTGRHRWALRERVLAGVFVCLSVDEATALHEQTIAPLRSALDLGGALFFAWVVLYVPLAAVVAALSLRWVRHLPTAAARLVVGAGALYVGGAVGMEMAGALLMLSVVTWLRRRPVPPQPRAAAA